MLFMPQRREKSVSSGNLCSAPGMLTSSNCAQVEAFSRVAKTPPHSRATTYLLKWLFSEMVLLLFRISVNFSLLPSVFAVTLRLPCGVTERKVSVSSLKENVPSSLFTRDHGTTSSDLAKTLSPFRARCLPQTLLSETFGLSWMEQQLSMVPSAVGQQSPTIRPRAAQAGCAEHIGECDVTEGDRRRLARASFRSSATRAL
mmetsp:Transcript_32396/g.82525  ORF Transcript_32396/g.82525 Transcript_32396/m.82525 type:complete len:201 (-) Transcript_32396:458-1060(-)